MATNLQIATLGGGCFWCLEAVYEDVKGVTNVVSGYSGGTTKNPSYKEVCSGTSGHVEVVQITFDANIITYDKLLDIFWKIHDPTTTNRQGNDIGTQYKSIIYYTNESQKIAATKSLANAQKHFNAQIVTLIEPLGEFYKAEEYHQNYFKNNPTQGYCEFIIAPKVQKLKAILKKEPLN